MTIGAVRSMLEFMTAEGGEATFVMKHGEGQEPSVPFLRRLDIPRQMWTNLGAPDKIIVTIEAGSTLPEEGVTNDE